MNRLPDRLGVGGVLFAQDGDLCDKDGYNGEGVGLVGVHGVGVVVVGRLVVDELDLCLIAVTTSDSAVSQYLIITV